MAQIIRSEDCKSLVIHAGSPTVASTMATSEVDETLAALDACRRGMLPAVPLTYSRGQPIRWCRDPEIDVEHEQLGGDLGLHVRHEGFGWLHFVISKDYAGRLSAALAVFADAPRPPPHGSA
jgi:hypothetical protein